MWSECQWIVARLQNLARQQEGQDLVEYALVLTLIISVVVASVGGVAAPISVYLNNVKAAL